MRQTSVQSIRRVLFVSGGIFCFALGIAGFILPVIPSAPFIICSAYLFSKGSHRFHNYIRNHCIFGPMVVKWENERCISFRTKAVSTAVVLCSSGASAYALQGSAIAVRCVASFAALLIIGLWFVPTCSGTRPK